MTAQRKREILTGGIAALLIVCAAAARVVTRGHREAPYFLPVSLLRSFIYIGLMMWWGVSLWQRIVQTQVRRYLAATAALCVFWLSIRTVKFFLCRHALPPSDTSGAAIMFRCCSMSWCYPTSSLSIAPRLTKRHETAWS